MLILTTYPCEAGRGTGLGGRKDRVQQVDSDRASDQQGVRGRTHSKHKDDRDEEIRNQVIYDYELMKAHERNEYREQLRQLDSEKERKKFLAQHREKMNHRATALGAQIEEAE